MATYEFYIYSVDIFSYNTGTGDFDFDASYDHAEDRYRVVVNDDDTIMNTGGDSNQTATIYDMDGNVVDSGPITVPAYAELLLPGGGTAFIDRIEVDGTHYGYLPSEPLTPGTSYAINDVDTESMNHNYYVNNSVPCFAPDTLIETVNGPRVITSIRAGDLVETLDHGPQSVLWAGRWDVPETARTDPRLWPVKISGDGLPPLVVSAQHRILLRDPMLETHFATDQALALAAGLADPVAPRPHRPLVWHHLLFERHELIRANGRWVESLFVGGHGGDGVFATLPPILRLQAAAALRTGHIETVRPCLRKWEVRLFKSLTSRKRRAARRIAA